MHQKGTEVGRSLHVGLPGAKAELDGTRELQKMHQNGASKFQVLLVGSMQFAESQHGNACGRSFGNGIPIGIDHTNAEFMGAAINI